MANHASALKRARQSEERRLRNKAVRTRVKNTIKGVRQALAAGEPQKAQEALTQAMSVLDKAAARGVIHANKAARSISRLASQVRALKA